MKNSIISKERNLTFDIMRIVAILAVVMIHVAAELVIAFSKETTNFIVGNILDSISRFGVPLFVMISGALMLNEKKEITIPTALKNAGRLLILLVIWSLVYTVLFEIILPKSQASYFVLDKANFWNSFIYGYFHLWYLYMLIGLYLITPILKRFVNKANADVVGYFILLSLVFQFIVPLINLWIPADSVFDIGKFTDMFFMGFVSKYTTYYLLGWYITNIEISKKNRVIIYVLGVAGLLTTILGTQIMITDSNRVYDVFYSNFAANVLLYSVAVFTFIYYCFKDKEITKGRGLIVTLSKLTFGVYVIHAAVIRFFAEKFGLDSVGLILVAWVVATVVSFLITFVLSKIPFVKKVVRC